MAFSRTALSAHEASLFSWDGVHRRDPVIVEMSRKAYHGAVAEMAAQCILRSAVTSGGSELINFLREST